MPDTTLTISAAQRDALYEQVHNHLCAIGDLWIALERNQDYATAERLALEFSEDFQLLEDLGWQRRSEGPVELRMAPADLTEVLRRLRGEAEAGLGESERAGEQDRAVERDYRNARNACDELLARLRSGEGGAA